MMPVSNTELLQPKSSNHKVHNYLHITTLHPQCMKKTIIQQTHLYNQLPSKIKHLSANKKYEF